MTRSRGPLPGVGIGATWSPSVLFGGAAGLMLFSVGLLRRARWLAAEPATLGADPVTVPLDLRWGTAAVIGIVFGVTAVVHLVGYVAAVLVGLPGFLFVDQPGPAVTTALFAVVGLEVGYVALHRMHPEVDSGGTFA